MARPHKLPAGMAAFLLALDKDEWLNVDAVLNDPSLAGVTIFQDVNSLIAGEMIESKEDDGELYVRMTTHGDMVNYIQTFPERPGGNYQE